MYFNLVIHMTLEKDFHLIWIFINIQTFCSACMCAKSLQSCLTLCDPMDCSPPGSSVHEIFQARILQWVAISYSRGSSWPRDQTCIPCISCIGRQILHHCATWKNYDFIRKSRNCVWASSWQRVNFWWLILCDNLTGLQDALIVREIISGFICEGNFKTD